VPTRKLDAILKVSFLSLFFLLNVVDMIQTIFLLEMGLESNLVAVYHPQFWFPFKLAFAIVFPIGIYWLGVYLEGKENRAFYPFLKPLMSVMYILIIFADVFYLSVVFRNSHRLSLFWNQTR
jgi:hypothetical protein